jgi:hypothetical protein
MIGDEITKTNPGISPVAIEIEGRSMTIPRMSLKKNPMISFLIDLGLLFFGSALVFSGLLIQIGYHMGHHGPIVGNNLVLGLNYFNWSDFHKISTILVSIGMVFHILLHWKWYQTMVRRKKFVIKNQQAIILTILFVFVAITGYFSWFIKLGGGSDLSRRAFIEIHDKITLVFFVYLILHVKKRFKWILTTFKKVKKDGKNPIDDKRPQTVRLMNG